MIPPGARVWIAMGHTDMRKGMQGLALMVQQSLMLKLLRFLLTSWSSSRSKAPSIG